MATIGWDTGNDPRISKYLGSSGLSSGTNQLNNMDSTHLGKMNQTQDMYQQRSFSDRKNEIYRSIKCGVVPDVPGILIHRSTPSETVFEDRHDRMMYIVRHVPSTRNNEWSIRTSYWDNLQNQMSPIPDTCNPFAEKKKELLPECKSCKGNHKAETLDLIGRCKTKLVSHNKKLKKLFWAHKK